MKTWLSFFLFLATLCLSSLLIPLVHGNCIPDQQLSLLHLKKSLVFDASFSSKLITWNSSTDCCSWLGVTCSTNGRVLGLDISNESISGGIDNSSSLFHLQHLQSLNLAYNPLGNVSSPIPSAVGQLVNLRYLNLSRIAYLGAIPIEISRLTKLVVLDMSKHYFISLGGSIDFEIPNLHMLVKNLTKLEELYLDEVQISAQGSEWCQAISSSLPNLRVLSLSKCNLSGPFHDSLAKLRSLSLIDLSKNNISGPVPAFFANFSNLTSLILRECNLQETFPKEVLQLASLRSIDLSYNDELHGFLPEFSNNRSLQTLAIGYTSFSGSLPNSIGDLKMLSTFRIERCDFSGSIPKSMAKLTQLEHLTMNRNNLEGSIPAFSGAKNLSYLDLSDNMLSGNIPSYLLSLPLLNTLYLFNNQFSGHFPDISNHSSCSIKYLDLSENNLEGPIPISIFNLRGLATLKLGSNKFGGSFSLDRLQHLRNLSHLDLSYNNLLLSHDSTNFSFSSFPQFQYLDLASGKLKTFPQFLSNQSKLQTLDLSDNQLHGKVPNWLWRSNTLWYLNLSCNSLETLEGPTINLTSMQILDLHSNQLNGNIPTLSSSYMIYLDYSRNNLEGIIPGSICSFTNLKVLDLSKNSLSVTVPDCLTTIRTLSVLNIKRNNLRHVDTLSSNCSLQTMDISENYLQGQFPKSLVNCHQLEVLNLGKNQVAGSFPCFLRNTSTLRVLVLRSNKFYGGLGCLNTDGTWPLLQIIDLAENNFSGNVPGGVLTSWQAMMAHEDDAPSRPNHLQFQDNLTGRVYYQDTVTVINKGMVMELVKILTIFTSIDFSCNKFTGSIPEEIGVLKSLLVLNLSHNAFTGAIPPSMSNLSELESLDLSHNTLKGQIPPQLARLTFLSFLNLSHNQLVGRIPSSNQFLTFPKSSFEGNKGLFGPPLTKDNATRVSPPTLRKSDKTSGNEIDWNLISVEVGFTCGFGIAVGSLLFCNKWRKWYYRAMYNILLKIFPQLEERFGDHRRHVHINDRFLRR